MILTAKKKIVLIIIYSHIKNNVNMTPELEKRIQDAILKHHETLGPCAIGRIVGCAHQTVGRVAARMGVKLKVTPYHERSKKEVSKEFFDWNEYNQRTVLI